MATDNGTHAELEGSLKELDAINKDINVLVDQLVDEEAALHAKYELKKAPLYKQRQGVIAKIPKFWLTCLEKHPIITSLIEMEDADAIAHLEDIEIERSAANPINYKVIFVFGENPYFSNDRLVKEFDFSDKGNAKVTNHKINWNEGKDLAASAKKPGAENGGGSGDDEFSENEEASFFCWFDDENGSELADLIANDLYPNAGMYFVGTAESDDDDELNGYASGGSDVDANESGASSEEAAEAPTSKRAKRE
ncbi:hypothetical protein LPJ61_005007 [Coemansia biformis]|uniref:NAP-domain-containing protein n=1 Tax=Coemansia biformis TaxID=1286918 RepID=A0A9W7Y3T8_9FUNG|nr:hypothetical protein LPJ61_005007 [Coemansia biformis]